MAYFMRYLPLQIIITHLITPFEQQASKNEQNEQSENEVLSHQYREMSWELFYGLLLLL